jgi:glycerol-3-phosphate acyltransferase PlsX
MRIAVDVMGGDHGCGVIIDGAKLALAENRRLTELHLVGNQDEINAQLRRIQLHADPRIHVLHASQVLTMEDKPVDAVRKKKDCSVVRAIELVRDGKADAVVSPGNTGGILAAGTFRLRTLPGISRGAIAAVMPEPENEFILLDAGANTECKPWHLAEFAIMGSIYSREILRKSNPRVGVLSNGTEEMKGTELTRATAQLCKKLDLNFLGYVEGHDLFHNHVDVVVCDGFVGNIVLKTCESMARGMFAMLKTELTANPKRKLGALLARNAFRTIKRRTDSENYGGAPLLGLNGVVFKAHASARERAILNCIRIATETLEFSVNKAIATAAAKAEPVLDEARKSSSDPESERD